jgi:hypothetical protein
VFDESDDTVAYYLDGKLLQKRKWGKPVKEMDCAPANVTVGHRYPGNTYQWDVRTPTAVMASALIFIVIVFFFLDTKNSGSNSGAKTHRFGLCS